MENKNLLYLIVIIKKLILELRPFTDFQFIGFKELCFRDGLLSLAIHTNQLSYISKLN